MFGILENNQSFNFFRLPKIEKITFNVSLVHFLLMFGYKLFSLYYPLFLISIGLSVIKIGWIYLLIYATISVASIFVSFYLHSINPAKMASAGILGYAIYALLMLFGANLTSVFYFAQVLLGISAAFWLTSFKSILIESGPKNYNSSFGWFYSAPEYASAFAPVIGGIIIYKFGFGGVFALSVLIQTVNAVYAYFKLENKNGGSAKRHYKPKTKKIFVSSDLKRNYSIISRSIRRDKDVLTPLLAISIALILGGIYRPYLVLFLDDLKYSQNEIIGFMSIVSLVFIPLSWVAIKFIDKLSSKKNIIFGVITSGAVFAVMGLLADILSLALIFVLLITDLVAGLMAGSGKSGMLAESFADLKEEISTIDTIIITLFPAIGGIIGGIAISYIGYKDTFLIAGSVVLIFGIVAYLKSITDGK